MCGEFVWEHVFVVYSCHMGNGLNSWKKSLACLLNSHYLSDLLNSNCVSVSILSMCSLDLRLSILLLLDIRISSCLHAMYLCGIQLSGPEQSL